MYNLINLGNNENRKERENMLSLIRQKKENDLNWRNPDNDRDR